MDGQGYEVEGSRKRRVMSFCSKSAVHTKHDDVSPYPVPIVDLLLAMDDPRPANTERHSQVYQKWIHLHGPQGEKVQLQAIIDGGAMRNMLCTSKWHSQQHCNAAHIWYICVLYYWLSLRVPAILFYLLWPF